MLKRISLFGLLCLFLMISNVNAAPKAKCEVTKTAQYELLVTFTWKLTVQSDKKWQA